MIEKVKVNGREYQITLTQASLTLLISISQLSSRPPQSSEDLKFWSRLLEDRWRFFFDNYVEPRPQPKDELLLGLSILNHVANLLTKQDEASFGGEVAAS